MNARTYRMATDSFEEYWRSTSGGVKSNTTKIDAWTIWLESWKACLEAEATDPTEESE